MNDTSHYVIAGGEEGKRRLNVLADAMYPFTKSLLEKMGVKEGISFLDNGCGGGNVSLMVAKMVGNGKVTAIDFDEAIIELAKQDAIDGNITNVSFEMNTAYAIGSSNEFDIVYARFLLSHLEKPLDALKNMVRAAKKDAMIVVEDLQFSGHFCYPANDAYDQYLQLYTEVVKRKGGNAEIGPMLINLFKQSRISNVEFDIIQPTFTKGHGKWMAYLTLEKIKAAVVNEGLATALDIDVLLQKLKIFTEDKNSMMSLPRIFRVWGRKIE